VRVRMHAQDDATPAGGNARYAAHNIAGKGVRGGRQIAAEKDGPLWERRVRMAPGVGRNLHKCASVEVRCLCFPLVGAHARVGAKLVAKSANSPPATHLASHSLATAARSGCSSKASWLK